MSKLAVAVGVVLATLGAYLLLSMPTPSEAQLANGTGDYGFTSRELGGWGSLGTGLLILVVGFVRATRSQRHDPDLPPEYRV